MPKDSNFALNIENEKKKEKINANRSNNELNNFGRLPNNENLSTQWTSVSEQRKKNDEKKNQFSKKFSFIFDDIFFS